jgi:hypothetical protein
MERRILLLSLLPTVALALALTGSCNEGAPERRPAADAATASPPGLDRRDEGRAAPRAQRRTHDARAATDAPAQEAEPPAASAPARGPLPPLGDAAWLEELELDGFGPASVSVPLGATEPRPVVVGVHGRGDRPEWACGEWRGVTRGYPFIVCPHGVPKSAPATAGLRFAGAEETEDEIRAGLAALHRRFGPYVASGPLVYAGFSLGAILAPTILTAEKHAYPYAVLAEGGQENWTRQAIRAWRSAGGRRALLVCSTRSCNSASRALVPRFEEGGIEARLVFAGDIGHLVDQRVIDAIAPAFPWLVAGEPRWAALGAR